MSEGGGLSGSNEGQASDRGHLPFQSRVCSEWSSEISSAVVLPKESWPFG